MWLFRHKLLADGTISHYKARLVANGSTQLSGIDVNETISLVVKSCTIQTIFSLAISRHCSVHQLDVKNTFLHGDSYETVYMHRPLGTNIAYLLLFVDGIVLIVSSEILLQRIISSLLQEFSMTNFGSLNYFMGISVTHDSSEMFLSQSNYATEILERAHMAGFNPRWTHVDTGSKLGDDGNLVSDSKLYWSLADSLRYLNFTRLDISYAVQHVYLYMHDLRELHILALKWILSCPTTRILNSGYCVFLGNNLLSWSSKRQHTLSRSSAVVEYRGVVNVVAETFYSSSNLIQHRRTKHIEIDIHFVCYLVVAGQVYVLHVPSRY
nr:hypothetical protein [Tanacetum cinerariifolium]